MSSGGTLSNAPSGTQMDLSSADLIDAVSHPTRRRILQLLVDEAGHCSSAEELAVALDQPVARVGYHLKTLARCEVLRLSRVGDGRAAGEPPRRGWTLDVEPDWLRLVLAIWLEARSAG
jgi:DNA-binding transcriptional ArsR family regulator